MLSRIFSFKKNSSFKLHPFEMEILNIFKGKNGLFPNTEFSVNVTHYFFFHKLHFSLNWKEFEQLQLMLA